jgi:hypothetical protein
MFARSFVCPLWQVARGRRKVVVAREASEVQEPSEGLQALQRVERSERPREAAMMRVGGGAVLFAGYPWLPW